MVGIDSTIATGTEVGAYETGLFCRRTASIEWGSADRVELPTNAFTGVFWNELGDNGWPVALTSAERFEDHAASGRELLVAGSLTELEATICRPGAGRDASAGKGRLWMRVNWRVFDPGAGEVVGTAWTTGSASITGDTVPEVGPKLMEAAFSAAVGSLLVLDGFRELAE